MLVFMVTQNRATAEEAAINRALVSLAKHSWKFRPVNTLTCNFSAQTEKFLLSQRTENQNC